VAEAMCHLRDRRVYGMCKMRRGGPEAGHLARCVRRAHRRGNGGGRAGV